MDKRREVEVVDSREAKVDLMEKVEDLTILYKTRENMNGKMKKKARLNGNVVVFTEEVLVHTKEEVTLTLKVVFMINVLNMVKKGIDPLSTNTLVEVKVVTKML